MKNLYHLFLVAGLCAVGVVILAIGLARRDADLLAPLHFLLFAAIVAAYLVPTGLAIYRDCKAVLWIGALNILLGWTIFGWVAALGWAASGAVRPLPPTMAPPPVHPLPTH
ncbi:MAG: superinfection immunity protein [Terracidiphilus sp.]